MTTLAAARVAACLGQASTKLPGRFSSQRSLGCQPQAGPVRRLRRHGTLHQACRRATASLRSASTMRSTTSGAAAMCSMRRSVATSPTQTARPRSLKSFPSGGNSPPSARIPHSWGFPTTDAVGYPNRRGLGHLHDGHGAGAAVQARRDGAPAEHVAVDASGNYTTRS